MSIHTIPLFCALINFYFLTDTTAYVSDSWLAAIVPIAYMATSYFFYDDMGTVLYFFLDYSVPSSYWLIAVTSLGLTFLAIFFNMLIAI